jgi:hypothetical protein
VVASLCVWPAVAFYLVVGDHARAWIDTAKSWLTANSTTMTFYVTLAVGAFFCADGLAGLI